MAFKTPGVYIEEISKFPPSVAEVETAVPAFIGYTAKAERKGENLTNVPTKVMSLLEYQELFGGGPTITQVDVKVDRTNNFAVTLVTPSPRFYMFEALRLFFDNGGGKCYIVSVGNYSQTVASGDESQAASPGLRVGLKALEKYDEPTMILFPDAVLLAGAEFYTLQQLALAQCAKLQDRVAVFDLKESMGWNAAWQDFRDKIGINNLKYGAAYTPWLRSAYPREVDFGLFSATGRVTDAASAPVNLEEVTSDSNLNELVRTANKAQVDIGTITTAVNTLRGTSSPTLKDRYKVLKEGVTASKTDAQNETAFQAVLQLVRQSALATVLWNTGLKGENLARDLKTYAASTLKGAVLKLVALEKHAGVLDFSDLANDTAVHTQYAPFNGTSWLGVQVNTIPVSTATNYTTGTTFEKMQKIFKDLDDIFQGAQSIVGFISQMQEAAGTHSRLAQGALYNGHGIVRNIAEAIKKELAKAPPSGPVAGVYAFVDRTRGVWKAPANVSLSAVAEPAEMIDFYEQEDLNVDVNGGKSINAIRTFTGLGTLVWGARTLAGNDNEWRYVPVRRFFNMVEESVKKSTGWAVFEPNDAGLWTKVKGMIDNYLIQKWREGALAGATPDQAFYVLIGLGKTMTAQDILEGRLIVEIGMAVVRPAEFIVLRFAHKMQEA